MADPRFARLTTDPRFRRPKQKQLKVQLDERFKEVLESEEFGGAGKGKGKGKGKEKRTGAQTDRFGRKLGPSHEADQLKKFYRLQSPEDDADQESSAPAFVDYARGEGVLESSGSESESGEDEADSDEEGEVELGVRRRARVGDVRLDESEEDSDGSEDDSAPSDPDALDIDLSEDSDDEAVAQLAAAREAVDAHAPAEHTSDPTRRIAVVNLDWDNIAARDIFKVFSSFLEAAAAASSSTSASARRKAPREPVSGRLLSVRVYPSEFGRERMEREEREGPAAEVFGGGKGKGKIKANGKDAGAKKLKGKRAVFEEEFVSDEDEDEEQDLGGSDEEFEDGDDGLEGSEQGFDGDEADDASEAASEASASSFGSEDVDMDKLRTYQLERLRYYYAIAEFSDVSAARYIMVECNGAEFERSANVLDLSFVPEEMTFEEEWRDEATHDPKGYKGIDFVTDALRHSNVKLSWDQDDPQRQKLLRRPLTKQEIEEDDFKAYLAASSDGSSEEEGADGTKLSKKEKTERLRALLLGGGDDVEDVWGKHADMKDDDAEVDRDMEITFKSALTGPSKALGDDDDHLTTLEKYQRRMKEKKERKKEKRELKAGSRNVDEDAPKPKVKPDEDDDFFGEESGDETEVVAPAPKPAAATIAVPDETRHFSMQDILKSEKQEGKKRHRKHKKSKYEDEKEPQLGDEGFAINVADERFKAIHEEPAFAIDPSDPHFKKTKAMSQLLAERTKRRNELAVAESRQPLRAAAAVSAPAQQSDSLDNLVASVKRKVQDAPAAADGKGGRKRKRSRKQGAA